MSEETPNPEAEEPKAAETAGSEPAASAPDAPAEPVVPRTPKERKVASRNRRGKRRPSDPAERLELRKAKAVARSRRRKQEREKRVAQRAIDGPAPTTPPAEKGEGQPKVRMGIVTSDKADKTITVRIDDARRHRRYEKIVRSSQKLHAHDETNDAGEGDRVRVIESRPLSATKRWSLVEVLERAK